MGEMKEDLTPLPVAEAEGGMPDASTFDEALAYIRPHPSTKGPVILKAGMLRCCVSAILMRENDLLSRLTAAEAARDKLLTEREHTDLRIRAQRARLREIEPCIGGGVATDGRIRLLQFARKKATECRSLRRENAAALSRAERAEKALKVAQSALAMLTEPNEIRSTSVANAWAVAVDAELKCRMALAPTQVEGER